MKFTYAYKTSDGTRHEEIIDASSREEVFIELRKKGIRPIKVVANNGSKANGETKFVIRKRIVFAALGLGLVCGILFTGVFQSKTNNPQAPERKATINLSPKLTILLEETQSLLADHKQRMRESGVALICDYNLILTNTSSTAFSNAIRNGYNELNVSRRKMRDIFKPFYNVSQSDNMKERQSAQRIYADAMEELERSESQLVRDEKAYRLLIANRGKWTIENNKVVFLDEATSMEFNYLTRKIDE